MNRLKKKIRSQTGASLTFALLLFLVCAVVGSVVLTAGTAAAGRMSKITESDQRFYNVNSAARLLIELIDGKTVTIIETIDKSNNSTYKYGDGSAVYPNSFDSIVNHAAYNYVQNAGNVSFSDLTYIITLEPEDDELKKALKATVKETISGTPIAETQKKNPFGTILLEVENGSPVAEESNSEKYKMTLNFVPDVKKLEDKQAEQTVITWKITWHIQDVKVNGNYMRVEASS